MMNENKIQVKKKNKKVQIIGLTGGIASGKTTVSNFLKEMGIPVLCADTIARTMLDPGKPAYKKVVKAFGKNILLPDKKIDRKILGSIVFRDENKRIRLNKLVHPVIIETFRKEIKKHKREKTGLFVLDVPLLFEVGLNVLCDTTVVVFAKDEDRIKRLKMRDGLSKKEALLRFESQWPLAKKIEKADFLIDNSGSLEKTKNQVVHLIEKEFLRCHSD